MVQNFVQPGLILGLLFIHLGPGSMMHNCRGFLAGQVAA